MPQLRFFSNIRILLRRILQSGEAVSLHASRSRRSEKDPPQSQRPKTVSRSTFDNLKKTKFLPPPFPFAGVSPNRGAQIATGQPPPNFNNSELERPARDAGAKPKRSPKKPPRMCAFVRMDAAANVMFCHVFGPFQMLGFVRFSPGRRQEQREHESASEASRHSTPRADRPRISERRKGPSKHKFSQVPAA